MRPSPLYSTPSPSVPDLAERGRAQAANARAIGEFTVKAGIKKFEAAVADHQAATNNTSSADSASDHDAPAVTVPDILSAETVAQTVEAAQLTDVRALALDDYDTLAASQIVKRLGALSADELEAVRGHEANTRGRRTILNKIAQLQA